MFWFCWFFGFLIGLCSIRPSKIDLGRASRHGGMRHPDSFLVVWFSQWFEPSKNNPKCDLRTASYHCRQSVSRASNAHIGGTLLQTSHHTLMITTHMLPVKKLYHVYCIVHSHALQHSVQRRAINCEWTTTPPVRGAGSGRRFTIPSSVRR